MKCGLVAKQLVETGMCIFCVCVLVCSSLMIKSPDNISNQ